ncbi:hypothetical protein PPGU19_073810 (plasmid) [Paraburkholderia sp. PGU19]|jgi:hypothetical protein|uniref:Uncharacterized protein n=2 Tax=Paraburkholderia TaxID=1822464 RepID=A0AAJ4VXG5_9BURK|nr:MULTISPECIES: hypothetical protein [Paraburkholderia]EUC20584.1 hypothetical protein PMI06_001609 [Burkholderia sp. BT03]SKC96757.1 hypothetical protein SAMN05445504_6994 [Burkholderia sp. CF099]SOE90120.1 hypothetical protein SAMN05446935_9399 [Burkholderia sp. YR290]AUT63950.1 hypothetical protein C2L65_29775 [Paraburkholderia terrae]AUT73254.1 hypothetical protein C2L64_33180 [Paraburkholderia hospita]
MKRAVAAAALAVCLAQPSAPTFAQTVADQCFAIGDIAGQVASWRRHKKTKQQALTQAQTYYKDASDRQAVTAVIDRIYSGEAMTPDQASMLFTQECAQQKKPTATQ